MKHRELTHSDRIIIETMLNNGHKVKEIAAYLGVHESTVYREKNRGEYFHKNSDWTYTKQYSSDLGQQKHDSLAANKGRELKIGNDIKYANFLENTMVEQKYSPKAALMLAKRRGYKTVICVNTLYSYIDKGIFLNLTNKDLPVKGTRKKHPKTVKVQKRAAAGISIERRPEDIGKRDTFGHWEMDTVKGARGVSKSCILVLTERLTRDNINEKLPDQGSASVVEVLDRLERKWGKMFYKVFKSITVDNGSEFADYENMKRSIYGGDRTKIYYCHPYSSWERGSNENQNKLIRRHIPKGEDMDNYSAEDIKHIENWMNDYPREIFEGETPAERFKNEVRKLA